MVSMTDVDLWSLRRTLARAAADDTGQPLQARGFAAWIQQDLPVQLSLLRTLAGEAAASTETRQSNIVSLLGFASSVDSNYAEAFIDGVAWLRERQYFLSGRAPGFEVNGLALLGVAVGLRASVAANSDAAITWLKNLLSKSLLQHRSADWNEALIAGAAEALGDYSVADKITDDLRVALAARGALNADQAARERSWPLIASLTGSSDGMSRAAAQAAALGVLVRESSKLRTGTNSVADVANVLSGVSRSMRRWVWESKPRTPKSAIARWVIDNEYHVQDMLWAVLAPVFPDLDDEEWLKSLGHHHPRADLAIPSLRVVIEVKFARKDGKSFSDLIQEVAADASTYLQDGSGYTSILAFIWDDAARTEEHSELRQGVLRVRGVIDAIVLPRPQKMDRSQP
jgi:REase_DpnII-MboI